MIPTCKYFYNFGKPDLGLRFAGFSRESTTCESIRFALTDKRRFRFDVEAFVSNALYPALGTSAATTASMNRTAETLLCSRRRAFLSDRRRSCLREHR